MVNVDPDTVVHFLINHKDVYIVEECYVVAFDVEVPWYGKTEVLNELAVIRLVQGDFQCVPIFLKHMAQQRGCNFVLSGTALSVSDRALARMYGRQGFEQQALQLGVSISQEIHNGWSS
ncbi:hypothetical protein FDH29_gp34 [Aquamicrobium phage P14]|uniref:Uncharacterized protein n=1 Tax=Aquamicrobium phage P14 TaxID=1927013 RepID=A0A1L5C059_9CAUD|nr:hypothetical protein FDH29_gp34 [Aquamicrobium phage P14]APL99492.1 hypothetical protein BB738_0340 [Aquamicrobium phage P14]